MDDHILITGIPPYDGEYPLDLSYFTMRELRSIYRISELRGIEISEAIMVGDARIVVALACLALERDGKAVDPEDLWDARAGQLKLVFAEDDADPPARRPPSENGGRSEESDKSDQPGPSSEGPSSDSQETDPSPTGDPTSDNSASDQPTSLISLPGNSSQAPSS
jgi:hypothetical protein